MVHQRTAPAKLNFGLHVLRKRADGYHDLETVFLRIPWSDAITAYPAETLTLECTDPALPTGPDNLCLKAALRLREAAGAAHGARLLLEKRLPWGSGLGGGSSDAACTLLLLRDMWLVRLSDVALHALAAGIGSDAPFFLRPGAAYAAGRGEVLSPLADPHTGEPYTCPYPLVVIVPPVRVATAEAYRLVTPKAEGRPDLRAVVQSNDLERWRRELVNDFEGPILTAYPAVRAARAMLLEGGAQYAALSGSGSAVYGVFEDEAAALGVAEAARAQGAAVWHGMA